MPHRDGYPGHRDGIIGHRDRIPEAPLAFLRWSRHILIRTITNAERWNIPPFVIEANKIAYWNAHDIYAESEKDPPPEPNPIDGFTIYWDKKKRFNELLCAFHSVEFDGNGSFDSGELSRRMLASNSDEHPLLWKKFLMGIVRENAARYNMPQEWIDAVRRRMDETPPPKRGGDAMQKIFFLFYLQN
jgi:hypothetical protein